MSPRGTADLTRLPGHELIDGIPSVSRLHRRVVLTPGEQVWPHVSTAEGALAWLPSDEGTHVSGPGQLTGPLHIGSCPKGTSLWRLLDATPPTRQEPGHVLWQEDWQLSGQGRSGPGLWIHLTVTPAGGSTELTMVTGAVRQRRFHRILGPVTGLGVALAGRHALHQLGLALQGPRSTATPRE